MAHEIEQSPRTRWASGWEEALAAPGLTVVSGEFRCGGQEHFYLEPMTCLAEPTDDGGISVLSSTQARACWRAHSIALRVK